MRQLFATAILFLIFFSHCGMSQDEQLDLHYDVSLAVENVIPENSNNLEELEPEELESDEIASESRFHEKRQSSHHTIQKEEDISPIESYEVRDFESPKIEFPELNFVEADFEKMNREANALFENPQSSTFTTSRAYNDQMFIQQLEGQKHIDEMMSDFYDKLLPPPGNYNTYQSDVNPEHVEVDGYYRDNGTFVEDHMRTAPNNTTQDNFSTYPNINPYTHEVGGKR